MKNVFEQIKIIGQLGEYFTQKCIHLYIEHILNTILRFIYFFLNKIYLRNIKKVI